MRDLEEDIPVVNTLTWDHVLTTGHLEALTSPSLAAIKSKFSNIKKVDQYFEVSVLETAKII